ncbi:MAG: hypothetical protein MZW92_29270 [Comamonadaceae bacterium]|nr:hypothetical protein [Comamonadaceae bacterium]
MGKEAGRAFAYILIGLIAGAMIALHEARPLHTYRPLRGRSCARGAPGRRLPPRGVCPVAHLGAQHPCLPRFISRSYCRCSACSCR